MRTVFVLLPLLLPTAAAAEGPAPAPEYVMPQIPDEATKRAALMLGYQMNGNSMVRNGSIDVSGMVAPIKSVPTVRIAPDKKAPK